MWNRRQCTKFNGVPYIVQRAAAAVFSEAGMAEAKAMIAHYMENAKIISDTMTELGIRYTGGINSPYIWFECPFGMDSWQFFDFLLEKAGVPTHLVEELSACLKKMGKRIKVSYF